MGKILLVGSYWFGLRSIVRNLVSDKFDHITINDFDKKYAGSTFPRTVIRDYDLVVCTVKVENTENIRTLSQFVPTIVYGNSYVYRHAPHKNPYIMFYFDSYENVLDYIASYSKNIHDNMDDLSKFQNGVLNASGTEF